MKWNNLTQVVLLSTLLTRCVRSSVQDLASQVSFITGYFNSSSELVPNSLHRFTESTPFSNSSKSTAYSDWMKVPQKIANFPDGETPFMIGQTLATSSSVRGTQVVILSESSSTVSLWATTGSSVFSELSMWVSSVGGTIEHLPQSIQRVTIKCAAGKNCTEHIISSVRGLRVEERVRVNVSVVLKALNKAVEELKKTQTEELPTDTGLTQSSWPVLSRIWKDYFMMKQYFGVKRAEITYVRNLLFADVLPAVANLTHGEDDVSWYRKNLEYNMDVNTRFRMIFTMEKTNTGMVVLEIGKDGNFFELAVGVFYTKPNGEVVTGPPSRLPTKYNAVVGTNMGVAKWELQYHNEDFWPGSEAFCRMFSDLTVK